MSQYDQLSDNEFLFTSESVTEGHPDKMADQISDGVLDAVMRDDPAGRVACETLVNKHSHRLAEVRRGDVMPYLRPDGKTQVTVRYENNRPIEIEKVLISTQHKPGVDSDTLIKPDLWEHVLHPILPAELYDEKKLNTERNFLVNPTGKFEIGGPMGDCGLTGRKIIVDTYGGAARHGGGAFSGKDPSKVDRSAAYAARYVAKNVVAAGLADKCEVQVAYAIGVAHPVSLMV